MKTIKFLSLVLLMAFAASCEKNELSYITTPLSSDMAEFQIYFMAPVTATAANYINRVELDDSLLTNATTSLTTYSVIPSGAGRYFTAKAGTVNLKLYQGTALNLVYDQDVALAPGKQIIVVHSLTEAPKLFNPGYPYVPNKTEYTDTTSYVKFYNFLYESAGVPTALRLQYQYVNPTTKDTVNIGDPVSFGETTGWQQVHFKISDPLTSGYNTVYFRIKEIDVDGNVVDELQVNSSTGYKDYSDYWTCYSGRWTHHILAGMRTTTPYCAVRVTYAY